MGLLRKMALAASGMGPLDRAVERLIEEIEARGKQGLSECTVALQQVDIGTMNRLDYVTPQVVQAIQDAGHAVLGVETPSEGWAHVVHFRVRPSTTQAASLARPAGMSDSTAAQREPGAAGQRMSAEELSAFYSELDRLWDEQTDEAAAEIWRRRLEVGTDLWQLGQLPQNQRFWINAYPVLAAEILALSGRPVRERWFLTNVADHALRVIDRSNAPQVQAEEFLRKAVA